MIKKMRRRLGSWIYPGKIITNICVLSAPVRMSDTKTRIDVLISLPIDHAITLQAYSGDLLTFPDGSRLVVAVE